MKMTLRLFLAAVSAAALITPADADDAAILKAIQGLANKVDGLQKDVDRMKGASDTTQNKAAAVGRPAPASSPTSPTVVKAKGRSIPGWLVNVVPGDEETKDAVATFNGPLSNFNFGMHTKYVGGKNEFSYAGSGFFHPPQAGRYVFVADLVPVQLNYPPANGLFNCHFQLSIADNPIITAYTDYRDRIGGNFNKKNELPRSRVFSGGADLEEVDYKLNFLASCNWDERHRGQVLDEIFPLWQDNTFSILVKGPDDNVARPFESNELFHVGKPKKS